SATSFCDGGTVVLTSSSGTGYDYQWYRNGTIIPGAIQSTYSANTSGNYTVTTTLGTCSKASAGTNVTVWVNPTVTVTPSLVTIEKYQTQVLTGSGAASYDWDVQPALVSAVTNSATFKPLTTTNYIIQGTDANGCKGTTNATIVVIGCGDVTNITATSYSPSRVIVRWTNPTGAITDTLQYRKTGSTPWTKVFVTGQEYEINGLTPGTDYEYNITPLCNTTTVFIPSPLKTFKTDGLNGKDYVRLFPNPVTGTSRLEIISESGITLAITIFDNDGKKVMVVSPPQSLTAGQTIKQVNATGLPNGIYHLAVNINGKTQNIKMAVMH
ncbi:MAG TPA: fibronectin type III domain-containing protein, partial [Chitinophagaceae bacterium]|nr:fibronectin type III domain-containing protein [Chitinophagaceae bacterium]